MHLHNGDKSGGRNVYQDLSLDIKRTHINYKLYWTQREVVNNVLHSDTMEHSWLLASHQEASVPSDSSHPTALLIMDIVHST